MKRFRIGIWEEIGGYVVITAENKDAAWEMAQAKLDEEGICAFPDFDITHRGTTIIGCEED